jgi:hypothetical protein
MKAAAVRPQQAQTAPTSNYFATLESEDPESPGREDGEEEEKAAPATAPAVLEAEAALGSWPQPLPLPSSNHYAAGPKLAAEKVAWQHMPAEEDDDAELQAALAASLAAAPAPAWHAAPADLDAPAWTSQQQPATVGSTHSTGSDLGVAHAPAVAALPVPWALQQPPAAAAPGAGFGNGYAAGLAAALRMQQEQAAQQWQQAWQQAWQQPAAAAAPPEQEPRSLWPQQDHYQQAQEQQQYQHFPHAKAAQAEEAGSDDAEVAALLGLMGIAA